MARILGLGPDVRLPSFRGRYVVYRRRGTLIISAWPEPRGKPRSQREADAQRKFASAVDAIKWIDPKIMDDYRTMASTGVALPRDLAMANIYGRLFTLYIQGGQRIYSMASRQDASELLDILGYQPGSILFRGPTYWVPLLPGLDGDVLAWDAPSNAPAWKPSQPTGPQNSALVYRSTDLGASATYPRQVAFNALSYDNIGAWDAGQPTRLTFPAGAEYFRAQATVVIATAAAAGTSFASIVADGNVIPEAASGTTAFTTTPGQFSSQHVAAETPWLPVAGRTYIELRINRTPATSLAVQARSNLALEIA